jgi:hypothetical protein
MSYLIQNTVGGTTNDALFGLTVNASGGGGGGTGGITEVATDLTLKGKGTSSSPLGINPLGEPTVKTLVIDNDEALLFYTAATATEDAELTLMNANTSLSITDGAVSGAPIIETNATAITLGPDLKSRLTYAPAKDAEGDVDATEASVGLEYDTAYLRVSVVGTTKIPWVATNSVVMSNKGIISSDYVQAPKHTFVGTTDTRNVTYTPPVTTGTKKNGLVQINNGAAYLNVEEDTLSTEDAVRHYVNTNGCYYSTDGIITPGFHAVSHIVGFNRNTDQIRFTADRPASQQQTTFSIVPRPIAGGNSLEIYWSTPDTQQDPVKMLALNGFDNGGAEIHCFCKFFTADGEIHKEPIRISALEVSNLLQDDFVKVGTKYYNCKVWTNNWVSLTNLSTDTILYKKNGKKYTSVGSIENQQVTLTAQQIADLPGQTLYYQTGSAQFEERDQTQPPTHLLCKNGGTAANPKYYPYARWDGVTELPKKTLLEIWTAKTNYYYQENETDWFDVADITNNWTTMDQLPSGSILCSHDAEKTPICVVTYDYVVLNGPQIAATTEDLFYVHATTFQIVAVDKNNPPTTHILKKLDATSYYWYALWTGPVSGKAEDELVDDGSTLYTGDFVIDGTLTIE